MSNAMDAWRRRGLKTRVANALVNEGFETPEQLLALSVGEMREHFRYVGNIGRVSIDEIARYMVAQGAEPEPRMSAWDDRFSGSAKEIEAHTIERCAQVAETFSIDKTSIYPDLPWDEMNSSSQIVCHTTCQQVAAAIRALKKT